MGRQRLITDLGSILLKNGGAINREIEVERDIDDQTPTITMLTIRAREKTMTLELSASEVNVLIDSLQWALGSSYRRSW